MATKRYPLLYAINQEGNLVHVDQVKNGQECKCKCPACGEDLIAKQGKGHKIPHFAHASGVECEYGYESSLHLAAKQILEKAKKMYIPAVYISFPHSNKKPILLSPPKEIDIDSVALEERFSDFVPDIVIKSDKRFLIVEIFVTHAIDKEKLAKIENENISTIEIDLSDLNRNISLDELSHILVEDVQRKHWKHNAKIIDLRKKFYDKSQTYVVKSIPGSLPGSSAEIVFDCPMPTRKLDGRMCADYWFDCVRCPFCIGVLHNKGEETRVQCTGREFIADYEDFFIKREERIIKNKDSMTLPFLDRYNRTIKALEEGALGDCPNCGCALRERNGRFGKYFACYMRPHCKMSIWYDSKRDEYQYKNE